MEKAYEDLVWLSNRLSGVIALKDELADYTALKNKSIELSNAVGKTKMELEDLLGRKEDVQEQISKGLKDISESEKKAKEQYKGLISEAKSKAEEVLAKASQEKESILLSLKSKIADLNTLYNTRQEELKILNKEFEEASNKLSSIRKELESLKGRI